MSIIIQVLLQALGIQQRLWHVVATSHLTKFLCGTCAPFVTQIASPSPPFQLAVGASRRRAAPRIQFAGAALVAPWRFIS